MRIVDLRAVVGRRGARGKARALTTLLDGKLTFTPTKDKRYGNHRANRYGGPGALTSASPGGFFHVADTRNLRQIVELAPARVFEMRYVRLSAEPGRPAPEPPVGRRQGGLSSRQVGA